MRLICFVAVLFCLSAQAADPESAAKVESASAIEALPDDTTEIVATGLKDADLPALHRFKSLKTLIFHGGQARFGALEFGAAGLETISKLTSIETLGLPWNNFSDADLAKLASLKNLRSIDLSSSHMLTDQGVKVLENMPTLESLNLSDCGKLTDAAIKTISSLTTIRALYLNQYDVGLGLSDAALLSIAQLKELETLEIYSRSQFGTEALGELAKLKNLSSLSIRNQIFHKNIAEISSLKSLSGFRIVTDVDFEPIGKLAELSSLDVFGSFNGTGLKHLVALPNLVNLTIDSTVLTDEGAAQLSELTHLLKLNVQHANLLNDAGLQHFKKLKELGRLELSYCRRISADAIAALRQELPECDIKTNRCGRIDAASGAT